MEETSAADEEMARVVNTQMYADCGQCIECAVCFSETAFEEVRLLLLLIRAKFVVLLVDVCRCLSLAALFNSLSAVVDSMFEHICSVVSASTNTLLHARSVFRTSPPPPILTLFHLGDRRTEISCLFA